MNLSSQIERALRPVMDRVRGLVVRGSVRRFKAGATDGLARLQVRLGKRETIDEIIHAQPVGFASRPRSGAEAWVLFPHGGREVGYALVVDDRRGRPELDEGETVLYNPVTGAEIRLASDGTICVKGDLVVDGSISASGEISDAGGPMGVIRDVYNVHTHGTGIGTTTGPTPPVPDGGGG